MYLLFYSIAIFFCTVILIIFNRRQIAIWKVVLYPGWVFILGISGARLLSTLEGHPISEISIVEILNNESGLTFYGGYIPIMIVTLFFLKRVAIPKNDYVKKVALFVIVFHIGYAIGRLGCHYSADGCYGNVTFSKFGMRYTWGIRPTLFPVYPTPLYETAINSLLSIVFLILWWNKQYDCIVYASFIGFPLCRFFIEFIRNNDVVAVGLTLNQFISLFLIFIQPILFHALKKNNRYEHIFAGNTKPV